MRARQIRLSPQKNDRVVATNAAHRVHLRTTDEICGEPGLSLHLVSLVGDRTVDVVKRPELALVSNAHVVREWTACVPLGHTGMSIGADMNGSSALAGAGKAMPPATSAPMTT